MSNELFAERFRTILNFFKSELKVSKDEFSTKSGINRSSLYRLLDGDFPASVQVIEKILSQNINPDFLIYGSQPILLKVKSDKNPADILLEMNKQFALDSQENNEIGLVPLVNITAQAGSANFIQDEKERFDKVRVPRNIKAKVDYAFEVEGDSMYPIITHDALAFCKQVNVAEEVRFGVTKIAKKIYVVSTNNQLLIKYLVRDSDGNLFLESANKDYDNVQIDISEINLLFRVEAALNVF